MQLFGWLFILSWLIAPKFLDWIDRVNEAGGVNEGAGTRQGESPNERGRGTE